MVDVKISYFKPGSLEEISELKVQEGSHLFSGGTDLFVKMRYGVFKPKMLIDTKGVRDDPKFDGEKLIIPMNTTYSELLDMGEVMKDFPLLEDAMRKIGSPQIRNRGTPVGNVCNASPAGDFLLTATVMDADVVIAPKMRKMKLKEFVKGPGIVDLKNGEFLYSIEIPRWQGYEHYFEKVGRRNAMNISIASIALLIRFNGDVVEDVKIGFGSVGPRIVMYEDLEERMKGMKLNESLVDEISREYMRRIEPITDLRATKRYRKILVRNLLLKAFHLLKGVV